MSRTYVRHFPENRKTSSSKSREKVTLKVKDTAAHIEPEREDLQLKHYQTLLYQRIIKGH